MQRSKIEWTDWTWNPITGCTKGCTYCYARKLANNPFYARAFPHKFEPHFYPERLNDPAKAKPGDKVFVCSMGELFGDYPEWTSQVFDAIRKYPAVTFQLLTKRPENIARVSPLPFPSNVWVGVSATDGGMCYDALEGLWKVKAPVKFISFEPLLDRINGGECEDAYRLGGLKEAGINWVIIGQQTPVKASTRPKPDWIREIITAANAANIPIFIKNNIINDTVLDLRLTEMRQEFPLTPTLAKSLANKRKYPWTGEVDK